MLTLIHSRELTFIEGRLYINTPPAFVETNCVHTHVTNKIACDTGS